jgi:hypothetical protein
MRPHERVVFVTVTFNQNQSAASASEFNDFPNALAIRFVHSVRSKDEASLRDMLGQYEGCDPVRTLEHIRIKLKADFMLVAIDETLELARHPDAYQSLFKMLGAWQQEEWNHKRRALVVFSSLIKSAPFEAIVIGTKRPMIPCFLGGAQWRNLEGLFFACVRVHTALGGKAAAGPVPHVRNASSDCDDHRRNARNSCSQWRHCCDKSCDCSQCRCTRIDRRHE